MDLKVVNGNELVDRDNVLVVYQSGLGKIDELARSWVLRRTF